MEMFKLAYDKSNTTLSYNGDVVDRDGFMKIVQAYPKLDSIMIGRGFLHNPMLACDILEEKKPDMKKIKEFHDLLIDGYTEAMSGEKPVLFKMKELWFYLINLFEGAEKYGKKIRKAEKLDVYTDVVKTLFCDYIASK